MTAESTESDIDSTGQMEDDDNLLPWLTDDDSPDDDDRPPGSPANPLAGLFSSSPLPPEESAQTGPDKTGSETKGTSDQDDDEDDPSARLVTSALAAAGVTVTPNAASLNTDPVSSVSLTSDVAATGLGDAQTFEINQFLNVDVTASASNAVASASSVLPKEVQTGQSRFNRLVYAGLHILFLTVISIPLFVHYDRGGYSEPWLVPSPDEQQDLQNRMQSVLIDQLPGSIVLVSFDYTPATEGEMAPLARAVIEKLRGQGLRIIAISLEPEGPAMAQAVIDTVAPDSYGTDIINLGYRPGGMVAVRQLALARPFELLIDFKTKRRYNTLTDWPRLHRLDEVGLIVAISANPDSAKWWVEQLETGSAPPMLAIASAAAEPFVMPYVQSGQYEEVIAGVNGAAALEATRAQSILGPASSMLDSQSVAHLAIMTLMLFGTISGWFAKYGQDSV